jgi:hypothetical protein
MLGGWVPTPYPDLPWPSEALIKRAQELTKQFELPGYSGEYKRHQVFAMLIKEYPEVSQRVLALAIEIGLNTSAN